MKRILIIVALLPSAALAQSPDTFDSFFVEMQLPDGVPFDLEPLANDYILTNIVGNNGRLLVDEVVGEANREHSTRIAAILT